MGLSAGTRLGPYEILAPLGAGGMGEVYRARDTKLRRDVAIKILPQIFTSDPERLRRGSVPVAEALAVARQIADALEAAHERSIVHRDLKPANVKITPNGQVKVLDFGLAKAVVSNTTGPDLSQSPTLTVSSTCEGAILGTAAYMSPEQGSRQNRR